MGAMTQVMSCLLADLLVVWNLPLPMLHVCRRYFCRPVLLCGAFMPEVWWG